MKQTRESRRGRQKDRVKCSKVHGRISRCHHITRWEQKAIGLDGGISMRRRRVNGKHSEESNAEKAGFHMPGTLSLVHTVTVGTSIR